MALSRPGGLPAATDSTPLASMPSGAAAVLVRVTLPGVTAAPLKVSLPSTLAMPASPVAPFTT